MLFHAHTMRMTWLRLYVCLALGVGINSDVLDAVHLELNTVGIAFQRVGVLLLIARKLVATGIIAWSNVEHSECCEKTND